MSCAVVCGVGGVARAFEHMNRNGILHIYASYHIKSRYIRYRILTICAQCLGLGGLRGAGRSAVPVPVGIKLKIILLSL